MGLKEIYGVYDKAVGLKRKIAHPYCAAVIVAAGSASRMEGTDKIFAIVDRLPVICRTLAVQPWEVIPFSSEDGTGTEVRN